MASAARKVIDVIELSDDDEPIRNPAPPPRRPVHNAATAAMMMKQPYTTRQMQHLPTDHSMQIPNLLQQRAAQNARGKSNASAPRGNSRPPTLKPISGPQMHQAFNTIPQLVNQRALNPPATMPNRVPRPGQPQQDATMPRPGQPQQGATKPRPGQTQPAAPTTSAPAPRGAQSANATRRRAPPQPASAGASVAIVNEKPLNLSDLCPNQPPASVAGRNGRHSSSTVAPSGLILPQKTRQPPSHIPPPSSTLPQRPPQRAPVNPPQRGQQPRNQNMRALAMQSMLPMMAPQPLPTRQMPQQMPRFNPANRPPVQQNMRPRPQGPQQRPHPQHMNMRMPPPVHYNQTKFKKTSNNPQALAIKNQMHGQNMARMQQSAVRPQQQNNLTYRQRLQLQQKQQMQERKMQLEAEKLLAMKRVVVEILDQRYHDNDSYEGAFLCGFGGCAHRLHNNINYFYHMWAHLARVLPYDYNESGKYTTTGNCPLAKKRTEINHWAQCPHCFAEFDGIHKKCVHYHVVHSLHRGSDRFTSLSVCHVCEMTVTKEGELNHLRQHLTKKGTLEVPYACRKCKYRASTRMQLFNHFEERHANTTLLLCPVCTQSFNVPNNQKLKTIVSHEAYINHIMRHFNEKNTRCPRCSVKMLIGTQAEKERYERHVKSHFEEVKIPPRLKQVQKALLRRDLIKPGRRVIPRKKTHKCAFCPTGHLEAASWNSRLFRRLICRNRNCNFSSTCKVEFSLHKVVCQRKRIRRANGTYVPVARMSVPLPPEPRTERTIYKCEKCEKVIELAKLGNPQVANHMVQCGGRMTALDPPKQVYVRSECDDREEKFEIDAFGLRRMADITDSRKSLKKRRRRRQKLPWEDVYNRALRIPDPKSLVGDDNLQRVDKTTQKTEALKTLNSTTSTLKDILQKVFAAEKVHQVEVERKQAKRAARRVKKEKALESKKTEKPSKPEVKTKSRAITKEEERQKRKAAKAAESAADLPPSPPPGPPRHFTFVPVQPKPQPQVSSEPGPSTSKTVSRSGRVIKKVVRST